MRIQVFLRDAGIGSRRSVEKFIAEGKVRVNDKVAILGQQINGNERILVNNIPVKIKKSGYIYILVNKPLGYTSTTAHFPGERSVLELVPYSILSGHKPVIAGRLDKESEGLMLLTDDGEVIYRLTHPSFEIKKVYEVTLNNELSKEEELRSMQGIPFEGETYRFLAVERLHEKMYRLVLGEGKKREIRQVIKALGYEVVRLVRTELGPLTLGKVENNNYYVLTKDEGAQLRSVLGLSVGGLEPK